MHTATYYIDLLLSGITVGSLYALIAIGYTMVYGILRLINFAHGDIFMMSGFFMIYVSATLPMAVSIPVVLLMTVLLGVLIERAAYWATAQRSAYVRYDLRHRCQLPASEPRDLYHRRPCQTVSGDILPEEELRGRLAEYQDNNPAHSGADDPACHLACNIHQAHQDRHGHARRLQRF